MLYRVLTDLSSASGRTYEQGELSTLEGITENSIRLLLAKGCIAPAQGPPLQIIPGWEEVADILETEGVIEALDLLEADTTLVSEATGIPEDELVERQNELLRYMQS